MDYAVAYRFLNVEFGRLGKIEFKTTEGTFRHRITNQPVPAVLLEVSLDTADGCGTRERNRVSIHERMIAVVRVPNLEALVFGKATDDYLNPVFGRKVVSSTVSCYDTQSGSLQYAKRDLLTGVVSTNISNPEAMLSLSRRVLPLLEFLIDSYYGRSTVAGSGRLSVNADGEDRQRVNALHVQTLPEKPTRARVSAFESWALPFDELASLCGDPVVLDEARGAAVKSVVPTVVQYDLRLGAIRATLSHVGVESVGARTVTRRGTKREAGGQG
jgi:hypothetical protein